MRTLRTIVVLCCCLALLVTPAAGQVESEPVAPWRFEMPGGRERAEIVVGETQLMVDLAVEGHEQMLGLGYRNGLEEGTGMLFVNEQSAPRSFWMKGMRFCIDIIWIENDEIVGAAENACPDPDGTDDQDRERYASGEPVQHVLEVPAGWMSEQGYGPGTPVDLSGLAV